MPVGKIEVDGIKEFQRATRKAVDRDLPKRMGQTHKEFGRRFVSEWLHPKPNPVAVGKGAGSAVRPSATKREVILRMGGAHRRGAAADGKPKSPRMQWGKRAGRRPHQRAPKRPHIRGSAERHRDEMGDGYLKAVTKALDPAFDRTEP